MDEEIIEKTWWSTFRQLRKVTGMSVLNVILKKSDDSFIVYVYSGIYIFSFDTFWLIDFNGISTRQGLFYAKRLGNGVHFTFMLHFWHCFFLSVFFFCSRSSQIRIIFIQIYFAHWWDPNVVYPWKERQYHLFLKI